MEHATPLELRRGVLAVSVLYDLDVDPGRFGVMLPGQRTVWVGWAECRRALGGLHPELPSGRQRLAHWLLARRWAGNVRPEELRDRLRPVGLPRGHVLHLGPSWVRTHVLGDALDLGLGGVALDPADPDSVVPLPAEVLEAAHLDPVRSWRVALRSLDDLGALAAVRLARQPRGIMRPLGDCDVVTLLGARSLRKALSAHSGGLAAAIVPMRTRGWTQLALIDPAFGPAAAAATLPEDRGFTRPVLVTTDGLHLVADGGRAREFALRHEIRDNWERDVLYR